MRIFVPAVRMRVCKWKEFFFSEGCATGKWNRTNTHTHKAARQNKAIGKKCQGWNKQPFSPNAIHCALSR